jgi:uncharacterized protein (DUF983 family)
MSRTTQSSVNRQAKLDSSRSVLRFHGVAPRNRPETRSVVVLAGQQVMNGGSGERAAIRRCSTSGTVSGPDSVQSISIFSTAYRGPHPGTIISVGLNLLCACVLFSSLAFLRFPQLPSRALILSLSLAAMGFVIRAGEAIIELFRIWRLFHGVCLSVSQGALTIAREPNDRALLPLSSITALDVLELPMERRRCYALVLEIQAGIPNSSRLGPLRSGTNLDTIASLGTARDRRVTLPDVFDRNVEEIANVISSAIGSRNHFSDPARIDAAMAGLPATRRPNRPGTSEPCDPGTARGRARRIADLRGLCPLCRERMAYPRAYGLTRKVRCVNCGSQLRPDPMPLWLVMVVLGLAGALAALCMPAIQLVVPGVPFWIVILAFAAASILVLGRYALFFHLDRPFGVRCRECGYELAGNISGRCPECGTIAEYVDGGSSDS